MPKKLICAAYLLARDRNGRILLVRKSEKAKVFPSKWNFVGGKFEEFDENLEKTLEREIWEELKCKVEISKLVDAYYYDGKDGGYEGLILLYEGEIRGNISPSPEISEVRFFSAEEIKEMRKNEFTPWTYGLLKKILKLT